MDWHVTWQDGAALVLGILGLAAAWWLHRRAASPHGCGRCPMLQRRSPNDGEENTGAG